MKNFNHQMIVWGAAFLIVLGFASETWAAPGVIEINQVRALAGGVTAGDAAGFPVTISTPGSYQLTGNLDLTAVTPATTTAIEVTSEHVTLDLGGHEIAGSVTCSGTPLTCSGGGSPLSFGVLANVDNVTVKNGTIRGMNIGVRVGRVGRVIGVRAVSNVYAGIQAWGSGVLVTKSTGSGNGSVGITLSSTGGVVTESHANGNASEGIVVLVNGIVENSSAISNPLLGISLGNGSIARNNTVSDSGFVGIGGLFGCVIEGNAVNSNTGTGIHASAGCLVRDNTISQTTGDGLWSGGAGYVGNVFYNNTNDITGPVHSLGPNLCSGVLCP